MRNCGQNLDATIRRVELLKGQKLVVKHNLGRNKITIMIGEIQDLYSSVFTFLDENGNLHTFAYNEVLTKNIKFLKHDIETAHVEKLKDST